MNDELIAQEVLKACKKTSEEIVNYARSLAFNRGLVDTNSFEWWKVKPLIAAGCTPRSQWEDATKKYFGGICAKVKARLELRAAGEIAALLAGKAENKDVDDEDLL